jgi:hypothetical protein
MRLSSRSLRFRRIIRGIERDPQAVADAVIALGETEWMYVSFNLLLLLAPLTLLTYYFCSLAAGGCTKSRLKRDGRKSRLAYDPSRTCPNWSDLAPTSTRCFCSVREEFNILFVLTMNSVYKGVHD